MVILVLLLTFGIAASITAALIPPVTRLCKQNGWLAYPGPRHIHHVPTPTIGGIAIIGGVMSTLVLSFFFENLHPLLQRTHVEHVRLCLLLAGAAIVAIVSFIDDIHPLSPWLRLVIHFVAALVAIGPYLWDHTLYPDIMGNPTEARGIILTAFNFPFIEQVHLHHISPWLAIAATLIWITGMQNMLNWIDGLDGLAAGVSLIAALMLAFHALLLGQWTVALLPLALAGACIGFLPFNFHPAHIFMGDTGAMTLGYILAVSAILGGAKLATALLVLGIPIIDMVWLILWRLRYGQSVVASGRDNLHIRLIDLGFSQRQVVGFYYAISAIFGTIGLLHIAPLMKLIALTVMGFVVMTVVLYTYRSQRAT